MKTTIRLFTILSLIAIWANASAQNATVSYPFAVGRTSCGSGTEQIHFYTYNSTTNIITSITGTSGVVGRYTPQLRIGTSGSSGQRFTSNYSSISYNPADHNIYFLWTATSTFSGSGTVPRTYVWRWPAGTMPTSTSPRLDTLCSFYADILGVAFDNNGNGYVIDFTASAPYKGMLRSINFSTRIMGPADTLALTGGATIYASGSGDVAMSPSGQMFFVVDNKLFTPNYTAYTGTGANLTCTYIDSVQVPSNNFVGLTYAQGETVAAFSGGGCPFREVNPLTGDTNVINKSGTVYSAVDLASIVSGIGAAKKIVSVTPTGTPNQYDVVYDVYIQNYGNTDITNVQVTDDLTAINGAANVSNVTTSFVSNPAGLVLNASFNGNSNKNLLNGTGTLPNYPVANNHCTIRISCRLSGILNGVVYNNSATATAIGYNSQALTDVSTNGSLPDLNGNDKPDDTGENQPTPLLISITAQTPPCSSLTNVLVTQNFGSGTGLSTSIPGVVAGSGVTVNSQTTGYTLSSVQPLAIDNGTITNNAHNANNSDFISLTDHTGNANGGMLVVNADASAKNFYSIDFSAGLCANQEYSVSFYAAFIGNASYQTVCNGFGGFKYPKVKIRVRDFSTGLVITEASSGDIFSTIWGQYGLKFTSPATYSRIIVELINDGLGGCGNDIAIDDIQFGSCSPLPTVALNHINAGCLGTSASFTAVLSDPGAIIGTPDYQWQISTDGVTWSNIASAPNAATYTIPSVAAGDVNKYYRAIVASAGNLSNANCSYPSPSFFLKAGCDIDDDDDGIPDIVESGGVDPLDDDDMDGIPNYIDTNYPGFIDTNGDGVNDNFDWDLDGIINELDLDSDNDGIPDVVESGGVDTNGDGKIDNYSDTDNDGLSQNVDASNTGSAGSGNGLGLADTDGDSIPNMFDLDSDNDGIPDVIEAYGADINNDGVIDGYTDADHDGFSDNVDGDVGNDGIAENAVNALLRTGADVGGDGRADSYPYKNMDADSKTNPYDLDSDGDGITDVREAGFTDANYDGRVDGAINAKGRNSSLAGLPSLSLPNTDGAGKINPYDIDSDDDGIPDNVEGISTSSYLLPSGLDSDGDGIDNTYDNYSGFGGNGIFPFDKDGDSIPDYLDSDTDGDGVIDRIEGNDLNLNGKKDDNVTLTGVDTDEDGLDDRFDNNNSSAESTSAYMGNSGSVSGDPTPGSITTVQRTSGSLSCATERDWRCSNYILKCEIISFDAAMEQGQSALLKWEILCDQEIKNFEIERSTDQVNFSRIAVLKGNEAGIQSQQKFTFRDQLQNVPGNWVYYRLKSIGSDGKIQYSSIVTLKKRIVDEAEVTIFPNPVTNKMQILVPSEENTDAEISIIDQTGRIVYRFKEVVKKGNNILIFNEVYYLKQGLYFLQARVGNNVSNQKFNKN